MVDIGPDKVFVGVFSEGKLHASSLRPREHIGYQVFFLGRG